MFQLQIGQYFILFLSQKYVSSLINIEFAIPIMYTLTKWIVDDPKLAFFATM